MRVGVVLGVLLALTAAGVVATLSARGPRVAGTNDVRLAGFAVTVAGGATACQPSTSLAGDAGSATLLVGTYGRPTPPLTLRFIAGDGRVVGEGRLHGGLREGRLTVPFVAPVRTAQAATACIGNGGRAPVALGGDGATTASGARVGHGSPHGVVAFTYLRPGRESWWPLLSGIAHRFGLGKARCFGSWTLWLVALALLGVWVASVRLLLGERPR